MSTKAARKISMYCRAASTSDATKWSWCTAAVYASLAEYGQSMIALSKACTQKWFLKNAQKNSQIILVSSRECCYRERTLPLQQSMANCLSWPCSVISVRKRGFMSAGRRARLIAEFLASASNDKHTWGTRTRSSQYIIASTHNRHISATWNLRAEGGRTGSPSKTSITCLWTEQVISCVKQKSEQNTVVCFF